MKKLLSLLICIMLLFTMTVPAYAEDTDPSQETPPETQHVCSWGEGAVTTAATCIAEGEKTYTCSCGATRTEAIPATGVHTYGAGVKLDDSKHENTCTGCGIKITADHTWNAGVETTKATCQHSGIMTYTCTGCNASREETIPQKSTHDYGAWNTEDATIHERLCNDCGHRDYGNHKWDSGKVTVEPTCQKPGSKVYTCTVCAKQATEELDKLSDHLYDDACDADCNVCGATRTVNHSFTTSWSSDYSGHWHECTKCGEKKDISRHTAGPAATEERAQTCTVCNYIITQKKEHVHKYDNKWTTDEVGHWHECTGANCKDEKDYASHEYDDDCDEECNVCHYKREANHIYDEWQSDEVEHWQICTVCEGETEHEAHVPGEEATDEAPQVCTVCDYELVPIQEHIHDFGNEWIEGEVSHWQECKCGELSVPEDHIWDAGIENKKEDTITYSCTVCTAEKTEEAPSQGFPWIIVFALLALLCVGGIVAIVIILKRSEMEDDDDDEFED